MSRREFLASSGSGFGLAGLASLLAREGYAATASSSSGIAPHHPPRAKAVIQLFMLGGASQLDTFDYKPEVIKRHGETVNFVITGGTSTSPGPLLKLPILGLRHLIFFVAALAKEKALDFTNALSKKPGFAPM